MVYYINECDSKPIDIICCEFEISVSDAIHEYKMSILEEKYNFICETGSVMPFNEAEALKEGKLKRIIHFIIEKMKAFKKTIVEKIKKIASWFKRSKHDKGSEKADTAVDNINDKFEKNSIAIQKDSDVDDMQDTFNEFIEYSNRELDKLHNEVEHFKNTKFQVASNVTRRHEVLNQALNNLHNTNDEIAKNDEELDKKMKELLSGTDALLDRSYKKDHDDINAELDKLLNDEK